MLRETGVIAVTGIKRIALLSLSIAAILLALCLFGILIWQIIGLFPALTYFSNVNAVPADAWVAVAIKSIIAAACYLLGGRLFKKGTMWWSGATSPLAQDFHKSAELISTIEATVSASTSEIKRSVDDAIKSTNQEKSAQAAHRAASSGEDKTDFLRKPCHICGSYEKTKVESFYYCTDCNALLGKP